jgi:WhiB family redox-sensing transcriptional regulator
MSNRHLSSRYLLFLQKIHIADPECQKVPSIFFPEDFAEPEKRKAATKAAKALCRECPLMNECRTYALETNQRFGIWGATSPHER